MAVKIRLARIGRTHAPVYRIVAIDSKTKRDGKFLENLGTYNPKTKELVQFHEERIQHWISVGAVVVDSVAKLQKMYNRKKKQAAAVKEATAKPAKKAPAKKAAPKKAAAKPAAKEAKAEKADS
jgi:small subunit ribosomal protein S16